MRCQRTLLIVLGCMLATCVAQISAAADPPQPYGPVPSPRQLVWHEMELYGFLHFTTNTFTDKEWGYGDEEPSVFHPTAFDANQIVTVAKSAGLKGLILTCKHHDGFCLWPSEHTSHSVASSTWEQGEGDVVRAISTACASQGVRFGVYLSPWDRNHADYGKPEYVDFYRRQLTELLSNYGPIAEVWLDGANGGDGYYGGARETRHIDRERFYDWPTTFALVRELQPNAVIFSDVGPDVRWIGNERGIAGDPCWSTITPRPQAGASVAAPGMVDASDLPLGHRDGQHWIPAEADVSIRPGWFYHASEDNQVKTADELFDLYLNSVGRGSSLLLNIPPDRRGQIHPHDAAALVGFRQLLDDAFRDNLLQAATLQASSDRDATFAAANLTDANRQTYWAAADEVHSAEVVARFPTTVQFNLVDLREYLPLGHRVHSWAIDFWNGTDWVEFARGESIGARRLWRGDIVTASQIRLRTTGPVCPALSEWGAYLAPKSSRADKS